MACKSVLGWAENEGTVGPHNLRAVYCEDYIAKLERELITLFGVPAQMRNETLDAKEAQRWADSSPLNLVRKSLGLPAYTPEQLGWLECSCSGPFRETVGMKCVTCGWDYSLGKKPL